MIKKYKILIIILSSCMAFLLALILWGNLTIYQYFHLASGDIKTYYQLKNIVLYSKNRKSKISDCLSQFPVTLPDKSLRITKRKNFTFYNLKDYKCYSDLLELFYENSLHAKEKKQLQEEVNNIVKKYSSLN